MDDTLRTAFESVTEHLRHQIDGKLAGAAADLSETAAADRAAAADQAVAQFKATAATELSSRLRERVDRMVSEIKPYHEPEVAAGRRDGHLSSRLGGAIARARVLYEERVPAHVRCSGDHSQAERVRTLACGDASLLEAKI